MADMWSQVMAAKSVALFLLCWWLGNLGSHRKRVIDLWRLVKFTFVIFFARDLAFVTAFKSLLRNANDRWPDVNFRVMNVNFGGVNCLLCELCVAR
jgi:hypothetical protein